MIKRRPLGTTGIHVPVLSLGGLFVSGFAAETEDGVAAVHRAIELGMDYIDTAPSYHNSEEVLGKALADIDEPVVLSTSQELRLAKTTPSSQNPLPLRFTLEQIKNQLHQTAVPEGGLLIPGATNGPRWEEMLVDLDQYLSQPMPNQTLEWKIITPETRAGKFMLELSTGQSKPVTMHVVTGKTHPPTPREFHTTRKHPIKRVRLINLESSQLCLIVSRYLLCIILAKFSLSS